jgi:hypothetical protein
MHPRDSNNRAQPNILQAYRRFASAAELESTAAEDNLVQGIPEHILAVDNRLEDNRPEDNRP